MGRKRHPPEQIIRKLREAEVGHPMLGVGLLLGAVALTRRLRREAAAQSTDRG